MCVWRVCGEVWAGTLTQEQRLQHDTQGYAAPDVCYCASCATLPLQ